jgi:hypothetical protein
MPLVVKSRRVPSTKSGLDVSKVLQSLQHDNIERPSDLIQLLYDSGIRGGDFFRAEGKLKQSFSNVGYAELLPFFDIPDRAADIPKDIQLYRCRLPLDAIKKTAELVQYATWEYGLMKDHRNEETRSRFMATLFKVTLGCFKGTIVNRPEEIIEAQVTGNGRIEHVFYAFNHPIVMFIEVKLTVVSGKRETVVPQLIAELDACDFKNSLYNYWCPLLGVLTDGQTFQLFVYDSSTRKVTSSEYIRMMHETTRGFELLKSIRNGM